MISYLLPELLDTGLHWRLLHCGVFETLGSVAAHGTQTRARHGYVCH
jgi:hypothetical protein